MIKHICDKCGKEVSVSVPTMWEVRCDALNSETHFSFEICSECMLKLITLLDSKAESVELYETNLQAIKNMDSKELARFITDLTHYDDTDYEWKSNLTPLLPFEDWEDWLNRRAIYGKGR